MKRRDFIKTGVAAVAFAAVPIGALAAGRPYHESFYRLPEPIQEIFLRYYGPKGYAYRFPLTEAYFEDQGVRPLHYAIPGEPKRVEFSRPYHMFKIGDESRTVYGNPALTEKGSDFWNTVTFSDVRAVEKRWGYGKLLTDKMPV